MERRRRTRLAALAGLTAGGLSLNLQQLGLEEAVTTPFIY